MDEPFLFLEKKFLSPMFDILFLDHVAIRCKDLEVSANWYEKTLGLKRYTFKEWGPFPIFMLVGKTGIALFPVREDQELPHKAVDHFAFQVHPIQFERAQAHLNELKIPFEVQDHHYFHSIYFRDPDQHTVELTTLAVPEDQFYG